MKWWIVGSMVAAASVAPAGAGDFPEECYGAYAVAVLGTVMKSCPDLRVTAAGLKLVTAAGKQSAFKRCQPKAKSRLMFEMVLLLSSVDGDETIGARLWCDQTLAALESNGPDLVERR